MPKVPIGDVFSPPNLAEQMDVEDDEDEEATIKRLENKYPELHLRI